MDNRCQITAALIVIVLCSWVKSEQMMNTIIMVSAGKSVDLDCGDCVTCNTLRTGHFRRSWVRGDAANSSSMVAITGDDRIEEIDDSRILRINDVSQADEGDYWCIISTVLGTSKQAFLTLQVKGFECDPPEEVIEGGFTRDSSSVRDPYVANETIEYFCRLGYELVGIPTRTCSGTLRGWSSEAPYCEPKYITHLRRKLDNLEEKITTNGNLMTALANRLSSLERRSFSNGSDITNDPIMNHSFESHLREDEPGDLNQANVSHYVEFEWTIENVNKAIAQMQTTESKYLESKYFYTSFPGYRLRLRLYLHQDEKRPGNVGIYLGIVRGKFDNQMSWPFTKTYKLKFQNETYSYFTPSEDTACPTRYNRPTSMATLPCGYDNQTKIELLIGGPNLPLSDRLITIKATIRLN